MKLIFYIITLFIFSNCNCAIEKTISPEERTRIAFRDNNVTSSDRFKTIYYDGEISVNRFKHTTTKYNKYGQPILVTTYKPNGEIEFVKSYEYDKNNKPLKIFMGKDENDLKVIMHFIVNKKNNTETICDFDLDGNLIEYTIFQNNNKGMNLISKVYQSDSSLIKIVEFNYDTNDNMISKIQYDTKNNVDYKFEMKYKGKNLISIIRYYMESVDYKRSYIYDSSDLLVEDFVEEIDLGYTVKFNIDYNKNGLEKKSEMNYESKDNKIKEINDIEYQYK